MDKLSVTNFWRCQNLVGFTNGMDPTRVRSGRDWVVIDARAARVVSNTRVCNNVVSEDPLISFWFGGIASLWPGYVLNNNSNSMQKSEIFEEEMGVDVDVVVG